MRRTLLAAVFCVVTALAGCGPGDPNTGGTPDGGGSSGGPAPEGGGTPGGGDTGGEGGGAAPGDGGEAGGPGGGDAAPDDGAAPSWITVIGGLGREYLHDVATVEGDVVVALNLVGVNGARVDELGLHHLAQPDGRESSKRFYDVGGAPIRAAPGSLASGGGDLYVAFTASCERRPCPSIGGVAVSGALLVKLSRDGDVLWARALRGEVVSNVAASGAGAAIVTAAGGVSVLHRFTADGALAWEISVQHGGPAAVALDGEGNVVAGAGGTLFGLGPAGNGAWQAAVDGGVEDVAASPAGTAIVYGGGVVSAFDGGGARQWLRAIEGSSGPAGAKRLAVGPDGRIALLGGDGCGAILVRLAPGGQVLSSRRLVRARCGGDDVDFFGLTATSAGAAVSGVLRSNAVDLGIRHREVSGPFDGFVVQLDD